MTIRDNLDCKVKNDEGQKEIFLENFEDKRTKVKKTILKINGKKGLIYLATDLEHNLGTLPGGGLGYANIFFNSAPLLELRDRETIIMLKVGDQFLFDCQLHDFCREGLLSNGQIVLTDCIFEKP